MVYQRLARLPHRAAIATAVVAAALLGGPAALGAEDASEPPFEQRPYRVHIEIEFAEAGAFSPARRAETLRELAQALDRTVGDMWQVSLAEDRSPDAALGQSLKRLREEDCWSRYGENRFDKAYRLTADAAGATYLVAGREWDAATRQLSPICRRNGGDAREIPSLLVELLRDLFRPVAIVEQPKKGPLTLRARAGALTSRDQSWWPLKDEALYEVYYRYLNKERSVERIQQVPWTYIAASDVTSGTALAAVFSGLRVPLAARRRRVEVVALAARRQSRGTHLQLITRAPGRRPLGGIEVEISSAKYVAGETTPSNSAAAPRLARLVSSRSGIVVLGDEVLSARVPVWLLVRSGQNLLARVPFVPGVRELEILELPDDTLRLEIEGRLAQLQSELVDTVARRAVLASLSRSGAKAGDWTRVDEHLRQLATLPDANEFLSELNAIRLPGLQAARQRKDRPAELRIAKLCDELSTLIKQYLDDDRLKQLREEVAEVRTIAAEDAAAERDFQRAPPASAPASERAEPPRSTSPAAGF
ncbi:MAG: hypothetical protein ACT4QC_10130 [Planctomycetaceae bacterium]